MTLTTIGYIVGGLALLLFISVRQMRWSSVNGGRMLRLPAILFAVGIFLAAKTFTSFSSLHVYPVELLLIGAEAIVALIGGWLMGRLTEIGTVSGGTQSRLRPAGLVVWFAFLAVRIGLDMFAHVVHFELAASTPLILCMVAIVKAAQALVVRERVEQHERRRPADRSYQHI